MNLSQLTALSTDTPVNVQPQSVVKANPDNANNSAALKNEFITLMVAQIQNQDPLNPLDGADYVAQLATFSQVQSTDNMAKLMQNSAIMLDNMQVLSTAGLVGQTVYVQTNDIEISDTPQQGKIELAHPSDTVTLVLNDQYGQEIKVPLGPRSKGDVEFSIDPESLGLKPGKYQLSVELEQGQAQPIMLLAGEVTQVRIPSDGGSPLVNVDGVGNVPFYQISQFGA